MNKLLRFVAGLKFIPEQKRLELYPPFRAMGMRVLEVKNDWREVRILLLLDQERQEQQQQKHMQAMIRQKSSSDPVFPNMGKIQT